MVGRVSVTTKLLIVWLLATSTWMVNVCGKLGPVAVSPSPSVFLGWLLVLVMLNRVGLILLLVSQVAGFVPVAGVAVKLVARSPIPRLVDAHNPVTVSMTMFVVPL